MKFVFPLLFALAPMVLQAEIRLTGVSYLDGRNPRFTLNDSETHEWRHWAPLGTSISGYTLAEYDAESGVLLLKKEGEELKVRLVTPVILAAEPKAGPPPDYAKMSDEELLAHGRRRTQPGDTFSVIARALGLTTRDMVRFNPDVDPSRLRVGQILMIRAEEGQEGAAK